MPKKRAYLWVSSKTQRETQRNNHKSYQMLTGFDLGFWVFWVLFPVFARARTRACAHTCMRAGSTIETQKTQRIPIFPFNGAGLRALGFVAKTQRKPRETQIKPRSNPETTQRRAE